MLSNSDHLQTATAIVAAWFARPGKDWVTCLRAKNKAAARRHAAASGLPTPWSRLLPHGTALPAAIPFPVVAKPCEGVASLDVRLCGSAAELDAFRADAASRGTRAILVEAFLEGELFTLETLGDGHSLRAIGGFDVVLSPPPHFIELAARWNGPAGVRHRAAALEQLRCFGVGFGVCHSEFVATADGPVLVEINYRSIGDGREFLLDRLLGGRWFPAILALHRGDALDDLLPEATPSASARIDYLVAERNGELRRAAASFTEEDQHGGWSQYQALRQAGDRIRLTHSNKDYVGVLRLVAANVAALDRQRHRLLGGLGFVIEPEPDRAGAPA